MHDTTSEHPGPPPVGALYLDDVAYERVPVRVTVNGDPLTAQGWVNGPGCPGRVKAQFARRQRDFAASADAVDAAYYEFLTEALRVVLDLPAAAYEQLDLLAGDSDRAERILAHLKWIGPTGAGDADPEARGGDGAPTTPRSSPTSAPPTADSARTASAG